jgi:protein phosphatase
MPFEIGALSDVGQRRSGNEDALDIVKLDHGAHFCVVADGMGGHQAGEVASRLAVETLRSSFRNVPPVEAALTDAIERANRVILSEAQTDPGKQGMGTTVLCALLEAGQAHLANVGDSPAFLVRGQQAHRLTRDHSWVAEQVEQGLLSEQEALQHPYRSVLTRCLGLGEPAGVETYQPLRLESGDTLVLCSDGLTEHVRSGELPVLVAERSAQAAAEELVRLANQRGGSDNVTVIVARWIRE